MQSDKPMSLNKTFHDRRRSSPRATVLAINIDLIFIHTIFPKGWLVVKRATFFVFARHAGVPQWSNEAMESIKMQCRLAKKVKMLAATVVEVPLRSTDNMLSMTSCEHLRSSCMAINT